MKRAGVVILLGLCVLPAHGEQVNLSTNELHAMTPIGSVPTKQDILDIFPTNTVQQLTALAEDRCGSQIPMPCDVGVRLRAIRALPEFCLPSCDNTPAHQTLVTLVDNLVIIPPNQQTGITLLLLRASIEALGIAKSGDTDDVTRIARALDNPSRDVRAAAAYALRDLCLQSAVPRLRDRYSIEMGMTGVPQVRLAISAALRDLNTCSN